MDMRWGWMMALLAGACGRGPLLELVHDDFGGDGESSDIDDEDDPRGCDLDSHRRDTDDDGIPDADDPFCDDHERPGRARADVIYIHSAGMLHSFDPRDGAVELIGTFLLEDGATPSMTDIAIDRFGVLYAVTFSDLHACDPATALCWELGELATNSLAFVPMGVLDDDDDTLVTLAGVSWTHVGLRGPEVSPTVVKEVDSPYSSSGDVVATAEGRTLFTSPTSQGTDVLVEVDPATGAIAGELGFVHGAINTYGLAAFADEVWVFDDLGQMGRFDLTTGEVTFFASVPGGWWGAAAHPE